MSNEVRDISNYFKEQQAARTAEVPLPAILSAALPNDPKLLAQHNAAVETAEKQYVEALLKKGRLTTEEKTYLGKAIAQYYRENR